MHGGSLHRRSIAGPDRRTSATKRNELVQTRQTAQENALALVNDMHEGGFSSVWLESTQISGDGRYHCIVMVNAFEVGTTQMQDLMAIADVHDAKIMLHEFTMNGERFSRIALWPKHKED